MSPQSHILEAIVVLDPARSQARIYTGLSRPVRLPLEHANEEIVALSETHFITYHDLASDTTSIPAAAFMPYGWDQAKWPGEAIDEVDPTWAIPYDTDEYTERQRIWRGEAEITEAEAADLNAWMAGLPQTTADDEIPF
jgi:hypothetical protein